MRRGQRKATISGRVLNHAGIQRPGTSGRKCTALRLRSAIKMHRWNLGVRLRLQRRPQAIRADNSRSESAGRHQSQPPRFCNHCLSAVVSSDSGRNRLLSASRYQFLGVQFRHCQNHRIDGRRCSDCSQRQALLNETKRRKGRSAPSSEANDWQNQRRRAAICSRLAVELNHHRGRRRNVPVANELGSVFKRRGARNASGQDSIGQQCARRLSVNHDHHIQPGDGSLTICALPPSPHPHGNNVNVTVAAQISNRAVTGRCSIGEHCGVLIASMSRRCYCRRIHVVSQSACRLL